MLNVFKPTTQIVRRWILETSKNSLWRLTWSSRRIASENIGYLSILCRS
jgi:hypothetical protein